MVKSMGVGLTAVVTLTAGVVLASLSAPVTAAAETVTYPVYVVERVGLTQGETTALTRGLRSVLGEGRFITAADGSVHFFSPSSMQAGLKINTSPPPAKPSASDDDDKGAPANSAAWDIAYLKSARVVPPGRAESILKGATAGLNLGDQSVGAAASAMNLQVYNPASRAMQFSGQVGTTVGRLAELSGLPVTGPGQSIDLLFGADGKVAYANINVRKVKASPRRVAVPVGSAAAQACARAMGSVKGAAYSGVPVYYVSPSAKVGDLVNPVLSCSVSGIPDVEVQEYLVDIRDPNRPVGLDLGSPALERIPGDEGVTEFGSAYLGDNARPPLNNACNGPCPRGWVAQDWSQINTDAFDSSMRRWGTQGIASPDSVAPALFVGGPGAQSNAVDLMWYTGHAGAGSWQANTGITPASVTSVDVSDVSLGQADLEWLVIAACGPLQEQNRNGTSWQDRLTPMFQGLHTLLAYATVSNVSTIEGQRFADYARGALLPPALASGRVFQNRFPLMWAWMFATIDAQPTVIPARAAAAATATTPAVTARAAVNIQGAAMGTQAADGGDGMTLDCLRCRLSDQYPSLGASVWRLAWGT